MSQQKADYARARYLFDQLTSASYYGMAMRDVLATNAKAKEAAEKLVECLLDAKNPGMNPEVVSK